MTLYYDVDDSVPDKNRIAMVHDGGSINWVDYGGTGSANIAGNITSGNITSFKTKFAIGYPPSPLPIELTGFSATISESHVVCEWSTASEVNNNYFTLERSTDGVHFDSLLSVDGAGNSTQALYYRAVDNNPLNGDSYYRLKQADFDGQFSYSEIEHVHFGNSDSYVLYPNPSNGKFFISNEGTENWKDVQVRVRDMNGQEVQFRGKDTDDIQNPGVMLEPDSALSDGTYVVSILSAGVWRKEKILIDSR